VTPARYDAVAEDAKTVQERIGDVPDVAVVLGSGLGAFAGSLTDAVVVPYSIIPHWPASKIVGHAGEVVAGTVEGRRVLALSGRAHVYEGHAMAVATFATRVLGLLGVKVLILTNAAGGINTSFAQGALMLISDHINLMSANPLIGPNDERFGARFPDMTMAYSPRLRQAARAAAAAANIRVEEGVYIAVTGPSYETPAEIRAFRTMGADAVGMSTVHETIVARHCGLRVAAVSAITNFAEGMSDEPVSHEQTLKDARRAAGDLARLLEAFVGGLGA
jgi:purine-nucleoside phosphorylase